MIPFYVIRPLLEVNPARYLFSKDYRTEVKKKKGERAVRWALMYWVGFVCVAGFTVLALYASSQ